MKEISFKEVGGVIIVFVIGFVSIILGLIFLNKRTLEVLIESTDGMENWSTVGVSRDVVEASLIALVDSIEYKLIKDIEKKLKTYF